MSMNLFEAFIKIGVDSSDVDRQLGGIKNSMFSLGDAVKANLLSDAIKTGINFVIDGLEKMGKAAIAFGKDSLESAISYESAFAGVKKTVDATEEEYQQLSDWIKQASTEMATSKQEIAGVMEVAGQLGVRGVEELETFTETMVKLGSSTNLSADEAAASLARIMNITGESTADADKLGSVIVALGNNFATTESEILNMATRLASTGTISGLTSTQIFALSTAMSSVGIQAEAGGTAMTQTLTALSQAVSTVGEDTHVTLDLIAQVAGTTAEQFAAAWKADPMSAITEFIGGLGDLESKGLDVNQVLDTLSMDGVRQGNMLKSLSLATGMLTDATSMAEQAYRSSSEALSEMNALDAEAEERYKTSAASIENVKNAFDNVKTAIGEDLQPTFNEFLTLFGEGLTSLEQAYNEGGISTLFDELGVQFDKLMGLVQEKLPSIIEFVQTEIIPPILEFTQSIPSRVAETLVEHIDDIGKAAETLGQGFLDTLHNATEKIGEFDWKETAETIAEGLSSSMLHDGISEILSTATELVVNLAGGIADAAPELIPAAVDLIMTLVTGLIENVPDIFEAALELIIGLADGLVNAIPVLVDRLPDLIVGLVEGIIRLAPMIATAGPNLMIHLGMGILSALPELIALVPNILGQLATALIQDAPMLIDSGIAQVEKLIEGIMNKLPDLLLVPVQIITELASVFATNAYNLIESGRELVENVQEGFDGAVSAALEWGHDLISNFIQGIQDKVRDVIDTAEDIAGTIKDILGFSEPKIGPLSNFHTFAPDMMELFAKGIKDNEHLITDQLEDSFDFEDILKDQAVMVGSDIDFVNSTGNGNGAFVQNLTINAPEELDPSEIARQTRNANREFILQMRTA